jgi:two-component system OmpR family sensor kinase
MGRLFWKLFLFIFLAQLTTTVGVGWVIHRSHNPLDRNNDEQPFLTSSVLMKAELTLSQQGVQGLINQLDEAQQKYGLVVYALDEAGSDLLGRPVPLGIANDNDKNRWLHKGLGREVVYDAKKYLLLDGSLLSNGFNHPPPPPPNGFFGIPLEPVVVGFFASLVFGGILAWYLSKPIRNLRLAFSAAADGELDVHPGRSMGGRNDELADLARQFDQMADHLHMLIESQRRLLHDVSHELRSPLARQQAAIDLARQQPDKIEQVMSRLERELKRMDTLVGELLALSRLGAGFKPDMDDEIRLSDLLSEIIDDARFEAAGQGKEIAITDDVQANVQGNYELLRRAIENVVRNAVEHTPAGSIVTIDVRLDQADHQVSIAVCDQGAGVAAAELDSIIKPFFRGSNSHAKYGHGLGLSIADRVIIAHGGTLSIENRSAGGLCVTITLPIMQGEGGSDRQ